MARTRSETRRPGGGGAAGGIVSGADPMNPPPVSLSPEERQTVLGAGLREMHGADARLADWGAGPVSKRGKHRTLRYDLDARIAGEAELRRYQWVGKFYEREDDGWRVARGRG